MKKQLEESNGAVERERAKHTLTIEELRNEITNYEKTLSELNQHKKVLRAEVLRLRGQYQNTLHQLGSYKDALYKMKSYFEAMFVPRIDELISEDDNNLNEKV